MRWTQRLWIVAGLALALPGPAGARPATIAYGPAGEAQTLDLFRPDNDTPAPLVVFVHGGGWTKGNKQGGWRVGPTLAAMGYVVATINYRMLDKATLVDEATDVAAATGFLLAHAGKYGIDPRRYALMGHSAGGHLVALVATDPAYARDVGLDLHGLAAVVTLDGVFDLTVRANARLPIPREPEYRRHMSPLAHVAQVTGKPVFCLVHEDTVPIFGAQADAFAAALQAQGQNVVETVVPGLAHGPLLGTFADPAQPTAGQVMDCLRRAFR